MKEMYEQLGISSEVYDFGVQIEASLKERFQKFDEVAEYNQMKVLLAMQKNKVNADCFQSSSGYGYDDFGRDTLEKETVTCEGIETYVQNLLEEMQANIYKKALDYRNSKITTVDTYDEFKEKIEEGGFILAHWDGTTETEEKIKEETKATIRCIPFESFVPGDKEPGKCMVTGKPSACRVIFARSY